MGIWDYLQGLASPEHPRIQRDGQDFVASNPPGPAGQLLRAITQNRLKDSPNTRELQEKARDGINEELVWISRQPGLGEPQVQRPIAAARIRTDQRGRTSGEIVDLTSPNQRVIVEYPEEIDFEDLIKLSEQNQERPDRARVYQDPTTGERFATNQPVDTNRVRPVRGNPEVQSSGQSRQGRR
jgi:hypothetical protein